MNVKSAVLGIGVIAGVFAVYNMFQRRRKSIPVYIRKSLAGNYNARTIPPFGIYVKEGEQNNEALINHEKVHWKQYQEKGLIGFYSQYAKEIKEFGYDNMPMEIEARENETEHCKHNYTQCVRAGESSTIYNPAFRM